jgi:hypothetical protein
MAFNANCTLCHCKVIHLSGDLVRMGPPSHCSAAFQPLDQHHQLSRTHLPPSRRRRFCKQQRQRAATPRVTRGRLTCSGPRDTRSLLTAAAAPCRRVGWRAVRDKAGFAKRERGKGVEREMQRARNTRAQQLACSVLVSSAASSSPHQGRCSPGRRCDG